MTRSITLRNLLGGFLGGITGILATSWWSPYALAPAVFLGVLVGWYHQELLAAARGNVEQQPLSVRLGGILAATTHSSSELGFAMEKHFGDSFPLFRFVLWLVVAPLWLVGRVPAVVRWARVSSERQARLLRALTSLLLPMPVAFWIYQWALAHEQLTTTEVVGAGERLLAFQIALLVLLFLAMPVICGVGGDVNKRRGGRIDALYVQRGPLAAMGMTALYGIRSWVLCVVYAVVAVTYVVSVCLLILVAICVPVVTIYAVVRTLVRVAQLSGHYLCLVVTLTVTIWSAWRFHGQLANPAVVWTVALATGVVSGMATETVRRFANWLLAHTTIGQWVAAHPYASTVSNVWRRLDKKASEGGAALVRAAKHPALAF